MRIILWIVFGALVGWIASIVAGTNAEQGAFLNVVVGIAGALIGGWIMSFAGRSGVTGFNLYSIAVALIGAVVFVVALKALRA